MARFLFAVGIEGSYPVISDGSGGTIRRDLFESTGHYQRWREDLDLARGLGLAHVRWGPPIHRTWLGPGHYDWSFSDEVLARMDVIGLEPILDLCHFGMPDWLGNSFQNSEFPRYFAEYARDFAIRYPRIRMYTPVNEVYIAARFSAELGWWNERMVSRGVESKDSDDRPLGGVWDAGPGAEVPFVTAVKHLCMASILAMEAILSVNYRALFIQSESTEYYHAISPKVEARASFLNQRRFLPLDLTYGRNVEAPIYQYLNDNGLNRGEYDEFMRRGPALRGRCILGTDYYSTNEQLVHADGHTAPVGGEVFGYYVVMTDYERRYHLPVMHTETNFPDPDKASEWLWKQAANVRRLREDQIPIVGFTWYGLVDMVDWDVALREVRGTVNPVGLFDLDRRERPACQAFKELVRDFGHTEAFDSALAWLDRLVDRDREDGRGQVGP